MNATAEKTVTPEGFERVSKEQFFRTVGPMNVHPRVDVNTLRLRPRSDWETPDRTRHGVSIGNGETAEYFLRTSRPV